MRRRWRWKKNKRKRKKELIAGSEKDYGEGKKWMRRKYENKD